MYWLRRFVVFLAVFFAVSYLAWVGPRLLDPSSKGPERRAQDRRWVNSSPYFWDRQACRWVSLCGLHHLRRDPASIGNRGDDIGDLQEWSELRRRALRWEADEQPLQNHKRDHSQRRKILQEIPDYVIKHAPLVHLYSGEEFYPSDIREHVEHMTVYVDDEPLNSTETWTLHNLHKLNRHTGRVSMQSNDDVEDRPEWLHSHHNSPNPFPDDPDDEWTPPPKGKKVGSPEYSEPSTWYDADKSHPVHRISDPREPRFRRSEQQQRLVSQGHKPDASGYSSAPAVLIMVDKGSGIVDAFWFFFYSYNLGQTVFNIRFGNHVGDWEHCMIRFEHGVPKGVFMSEHEGGQAYIFHALEKRGDRPVIYSAVGSHANYPMPGNHPYILPFSMLKDQTDRGLLWDPALNTYAYHYDYEKGNEEAADDDLEPTSLVPAASNPDAPTSWFHFRGNWGDETYSLADPRQWRLFSQYHYITGPQGPIVKNLARSKMCTREKCKLLYGLDSKATWY